MKTRNVLLGFCCVLVSGCVQKNETNEENSPPYVVSTDQITAGKYLITVGGCNDCHTNGYMVEGMNIPEEEWLTGSPLGWQGPWGTTYPTNLRLRVHQIDEDQWVKTLKERKGLPPMPWMNVNQISDRDARAMYAYIKSLGPKGDQMPMAVGPGVMPSTPFLSMDPQNMPDRQP